jgi:hypothetical protein
VPTSPIYKGNSLSEDYTCELQEEIQSLLGELSETREKCYSPAGGNPKRKTQGNLAAGYRYIYR